MVLVFDSRATGYGQEYHPERPARLIRGERHLREGHPDSAVGEARARRR